jgi:hypothetical protein
VRGYHGLEQIESHLFLVGGGTNERSLNACSKLDLATHTWSPICSMSHARCFVSTAVLDGELYAIGGRELEQRLNNAEKYNPKTDTWARIANMHHQHSDASAAALDGNYILKSAAFFNLQPETLQLEQNSAQPSMN